MRSCKDWLPGGRDLRHAPYDEEQATMVDFPTGDTSEAQRQLLDTEAENEAAEELGRPVRLAVFDFDGTSISGNSPVLLCRYLVKRKMLRKSVVLRLLLWGAAYSLRLPQNESWVRGLVFTAFEGKSKREVDEFLFRFYDDVIRERFRPQADEAMCRYRQEGFVVMVVSATFEPIILRAMEHHPFDCQISTRMEVAPDGTYTTRVEGAPVEGAEKLAAIRRLADGRYGAGGWVLEAAYGDHHSDRVLLGAARKAYAVDPDRPLRRTAKRNGWTVLDW